jgi:predicted amidophosphoribosyltransferase
VEDRLRNAPGFGECGVCPYRDAGPAALCFACARRSMERLVHHTRRCEVCDRPFESGEADCRNPVCNYGERWFDWNFAVAMRSGPLEEAISRFKYQDRHGWALIFGRILAGFLDERTATFDWFDLIVASPTWTGEGGRTFDHSRAVLERAAQEIAPDAGWPFDLDATPAIVKTAATPRFAGLSYQDRRSAAEGVLRASLSVPDPARVRGRRILVYDDVFTDGLTLREVARALRMEGGADVVCGVTLCRQPWRGSGT